MAVIALASGMGTGVKYVAEMVARRLGVEVVYREVCPTGSECPQSAVRKIERLSQSHWDAGLSYLTASRHEQGLTELEEICRWAQRGNVLICGATALHFLSSIGHVTKIRVRTTMALRVRRIMACMGTDEPELALNKILQSDQRQSDTLRKLFGIGDAESPALYDSVIDTGREPVESCALEIVKVAAQRAAVGAERWAETGAMLQRIHAARASLSGAGQKDSVGMSS